MLDGFGLLLVDDHPLFRDGLAAALRHHAPLLSVQTVGSFAAALRQLDAAPEAFDLVLLDYLLPGADGLQCAGLLSRRHPGVAVALMSGLDDPSLPRRARDAGLCAFLPKTLEVPALLQHLRRLARGELVFDSPAADASTDVAPPMRLDDLTPRQLQVLRALADGGSNKDIAREMGIAPTTVKKHLEVVFIRLGTANRVQAAMKARALFGESPP